MSAYSNTELQLPERLAIDGTVLEARGWVSFKLSLSCESDLREQLLALPAGFGAAAATRSGGSLCETLLHTEADAAT